MNSSHDKIILYHKPKAVVVSSKDELRRKTVYDALPQWVRDEGYQPVGRLDRDTRGLLLFVSNPEWIESLTKPGNIEKRYEVWVRGHISQQQIRQLNCGVETAIGHLKWEDASLVGYVGPKSRLEVVLKEGKNRQIRRMFGALLEVRSGRSLKVLDLKRISFGPIVLDVPSGHWRFLTEQEVQALKDL